MTLPYLPMTYSVANDEDVGLLNDQDEYIGGEYEHINGGYGDSDSSHGDVSLPASWLWTQSWADCNRRALPLETNIAYQLWLLAQSIEHNGRTYHRYHAESTVSSYTLDLGYLKFSLCYN